MLSNFCLVFDSYGEISLSVYQATDDEEEGGQVAEDRVAVSVENVPGAN